MANEIEVAKLKVKLDHLAKDVEKIGENQQKYIGDVREAIREVENRLSAIEKPLDDLVADKQAIIKKMWGLLWTVITVIVLLSLGLKK